MIYGPDASKCPIKKQVLNAGKEPLIEFCDEMKVCSSSILYLFSLDIEFIFRFSSIF